MREVIVSDTATTELRLIDGYLLAFGRHTASSFVDEVEKKLTMLEEGAVEFPLAPHFRLAQLGYRIIFVKSYLMLYRVLGDGSVFVAHVFHQSQDYASLVLKSE